MKVKEAIKRILDDQTVVAHFAGEFACFPQIQTAEGENLKTKVMGVYEAVQLDCIRWLDSYRTSHGWEVDVPCLIEKEIYDARVKTIAGKMYWAEFDEEPRGEMRATLDEALGDIYEECCVKPTGWGEFDDIRQDIIKAMEEGDYLYEIQTEYGSSFDRLMITPVYVH